MWSLVRFHDPFLFDKGIHRIVYEIRNKYGYDAVDYLGIRATGETRTNPRDAFIKTKLTSVVLLEYSNYIERIDEHTS